MATRIPLLTRAGVVVRVKFKAGEQHHFTLKKPGCEGKKKEGGSYRRQRLRDENACL